MQEKQNRGGDTQPEMEGARRAAPSLVAKVVEGIPRESQNAHCDQKETSVHPILASVPRTANVSGQQGSEKKNKADG